MILSSSTPNPVQPIGSTVVLTCTVYVELSPAVVDPVTVKAVLNGPDGFMATNTSQPILGGSTIHTSTAMISSFGQTQSGVYSCTATLHSMLTNAYGNTNSSSAKVDYTQVTTGEIANIISEMLGYIILAIFCRCLFSSER